ncbi:hypothetical protein PVAP13_1NG130400 [Panicum virgatum]|uniref:Disease resistance R13L4/SHOC-2-like LRR domain-containing protein n=1 Tax=Panicum virgatum TaxID=38727 RepID=A0A8T0WTX2_PANVG|nr:hypothetical protein PVAP13_1NG130400 [Panicum virgatum]
MQCLDVVVPGRGGLLAAARRAPRLLGTLFTRHRIAVRIRELKARARDLGERRLRYDVSIRDGGTSRGVHPAPVEKGDDVEARRRALDDVTNFLNDDIREVICWLTKELPDQDPQRQLRVVAVVRRQYQEDEYPLARKVYEHPSLSRRFDFKAWINGTGTQYTKRQEALLCVLQQLRVPLVSDITDEKKLAEKLRDHLRGKRFLITAANDPYGSVRAAVESACTTDLLSFPPGSAILVTTWLPPPREPPPPYQVKNYLEIVYFFYDKAVMLVGGHGCDIVIKEILRKIMMRRGWNFYSMEMFLRALYMNPNRSREELQNLLDRLTPPTIAERIMEYCYNDLPSHYKTCLLYLSILFGKTNGGESGSPMDSNKKKKKKKHQKEVPQSTTRWKRLAPMDSSEGSKLAVQVDDTEAFLESLPISPPLGLLQVLDLEGFKGLRRHHLRDICNKMFQLKYLSLRSTAVTELPKDIEKLRYLETLDIRQTRIRTFTTKAIVLPKLVHLLAGQVENQGCGVKRFVSTAHMPRGIGSMTDLQILCHVVVSSSADELVEVGRLQQLRKLGLVLRGKEARLSHFLRVIERLNESLRSLSVKIELNSSKTPDLSIGKMAFSPPRLLESLTINGRITGLPIWIKDLSALVKIALHGTSLMDNAIRMLGELVRLRCLRILHGSYIESRLIIKDGEFQNLNYLLVEGSEVTNIHFGSRAAPKLEKIVWAFTKMETISGIKRLESLKEIELHGDCNPYSIIKDMAEHKNHPVVIHNANHEATN